MLDKRVLKNRRNFFNKKYIFTIMFSLIANGLSACELIRTDSVRGKVLSRSGSLQQLQKKVTQHSVKEYWNGQAHNNGPVVDFSVQLERGFALFLKNRGRRKRKGFFGFSNLHIRISQADDFEGWKEEKARYGIR